MGEECVFGFGDVGVWGDSDNGVEIVDCYGGIVKIFEFV